MKLMISMLGALSITALVPVAASAQDMVGLPVCGPGVTDKCQQSAGAERMAAAEYKGGGRDNSAAMGAKSASVGKARASRGHARAMHHRTKPKAKMTTTTTTQTSEMPAPTN